jgi:hypothetical protein
MGIFSGKAPNESRPHTTAGAQHNNVFSRQIRHLRSSISAQKGALAWRRFNVREFIGLARIFARRVQCPRWRRSNAACRLMKSLTAIAKEIKNASRASRFEKPLKLFPGLSRVRPGKRYDRTVANLAGATNACSL